MKTREWLLVVAYVLLVGIVAVGGWFIQDQFEEQHDNECAIAAVQARLAAANLVTTARPSDRTTLRPIVNMAIRQLNDTCGTDVTEIP